MDLSQFKRWPVVCFNHKYDELPVGTAEWIGYTPGGIKAKTRYGKRPDNHQGPWLPDMIFGLIQQNMCQGKSIGFVSTEVRPPTKTDPIEWQKASLIHSRAICIEYSVATVPMNQDALVQTISKGLADEATLRRLGLVCQMSKGVLRRTQSQRWKPIQSRSGEFGRTLPSLSPSSGPRKATCNAEQILVSINGSIATG